MNEVFPTELGILACLGVLAALIWIPYVIGIANDPSGEDPFAKPANRANLRPWVQRAYRAHQNLLEQLLPFAILTLMVDRVDGFTALTFYAAIAFFWIRIIHAIGMITGFAGNPIRPMIFFAGLICILIMAYAFFTGMPA